MGQREKERERTSALIKEETDEKGSVDIFVLLQRGWLINQLLGVVGRERRVRELGLA